MWFQSDLELFGYIDTDPEFSLFTCCQLLESSLKEILWRRCGRIPRRPCAASWWRRFPGTTARWRSASPPRPVSRSSPSPPKRERWIGSAGPRMLPRWEDDEIQCSSECGSGLWWIRMQVRTHILYFLWPYIGKVPCQLRSKIADSFLTLAKRTFKGQDW